MSTQLGEIDPSRGGPTAIALHLAPVAPGDLQWINAAVDRWHGSLRWSIASQVPTLAEVQARMWLGVDDQRAVCISGAEPVGLLQLVDVDLHNGVADLGLLVAPLMIEHVRPAVEAFVDGIAVDRPVRKLMFGCVSGGLPVQHLLGDRAVPVGRRHQHQRAADGGFDDVDLYEVWCKREDGR